MADDEERIEHLFCKVYTYEVIVGLLSTNFKIKTSLNTSIQDVLMASVVQSTIDTRKCRHDTILILKFIIFRDRFVFLSFLFNVLRFI